MAAVISKVDEILSVLRTEILRGQYRAGERLPSERDLAARFGSNRGAIREVIKKLEQLGIIEVNPGGVRVLPVEEATLDVLAHLLELGELDQPQLIGQLLDVLGSMMGLSVRLALESATPEDSREMTAAIDSLLASIDQNDQELHHESWRKLNEKLISAHQNLVLRLVGNGIRTQFITNIQKGNFDPNFDASPIRAALVAFKNAVEARDAAAASAAVNQHFVLLKGAIQTTPVEEPTRSADYA